MELHLCGSVSVGLRVCTIGRMACGVRGLDVGEGEVGFDLENPTALECRHTDPHMPFIWFRQSAKRASGEAAVEGRGFSALRG